MPRKLKIQISGQGLHDITDLMRREVKQTNKAEGLCHLFIQHTSASLLIQENYDPTSLL